MGLATALQGAGSGRAELEESTSIGGLKPQTKYYFRINAQNPFGTVTGTTRSFTTQGPPSPGAAKINATSASDIATSSARLHGTVNPNGDATTYWFEYGVDSLLGNILKSTTQTALAGMGTEPVAVSAAIDELQPNTRYYFRLVGRNSYGTVRSDIKNFRTRP